MNRNGSDMVSKVMMIIVSILNSGRNSLAFFLLLIVCMSCRVVRPSLREATANVRWLTGSHFIFNFIYSIVSLAIIPERVGKSALSTCKTTY